jgi:hypothetical protein
MALLKQTAVNILNNPIKLWQKLAALWAGGLSCNKKKLSPS